MKLNLVLISTLVLFVISCTSTKPPPTSTTSESKVIQITDVNYEEFVRSQRVVLILFWAPWSAPDRLIAPTIDSIANEYSDRVKIGKVNVDDNPNLANRFGIQGIPTVVVIKDGNEQERIVGVTARKTISHLLDKQLEQ